MFEIEPLGPAVSRNLRGGAATVQFAGSAPGEVAGVLQVNAVVPFGVMPGPAVPVTLSVGDIPSQNVTMAVK